MRWEEIWYTQYLPTYLASKHASRIMHAGTGIDGTEKKAVFENKQSDDRDWPTSFRISRHSQIPVEKHAVEEEDEEKNTQ